MIRTRLRSLGYAVFYRIPPRWRLRLVRLLTVRYTIGAVVLILDSDSTGQRILLLRQPPGRGWGLPAGLLERGETPIDGACREAFEETGVQLTPADLTPGVPNAMVHTKGKWVDVVFLASVSAATAELKVDGAEVWEAAWHPLSDLPKLTAPTAKLLDHYGYGSGDGR